MKRMMIIREKEFRDAMLRSYQIGLNNGNKISMDQHINKVVLDCNFVEDGLEEE